jgi:branched-chain amino acid transport system substrate-binding protein
VTRNGRVALCGLLLAGLCVLPACGSRQPFEKLAAYSTVTDRGRTQADTPPAASGVGVGAETPTPVEGSQTTTAGVATGTPVTAAPTAPKAATPAGGCTTPGETINIGSFGQLSGLFAQFLSPAVRGVSAWVASVNARGGINCHPLKYIALDDGGDPARAQAAARRLVEQEHVVAIVAEASVLAGNAAVSYLTAHNIPMIGQTGGDPWFYQSPMYFPQMTSGDLAVASAFAAGGRIGIPQGKTAMATLTCVEAALCTNMYKGAPALAKQYGLHLTYQGQVSLTQPDFTSSCQSAMNSHADLVAVALDTNSIKRLTSDCGSIGYHPLYFTGGPMVTPDVAQYKPAEGFIDVAFTVPFNDTSNPQVTAMQTALKRYAPGVAPSIGVMTGWVAGIMFERAASHDPTHLTSQSLLEGLWSMKNDDLGGTTQPLTFQRGQNAPPTICYWILQVKDGDFRPTGPSGRICE